MGWSSGTDLMEAIIKAAFKAIPNPTSRNQFYKAVIRAFEESDWDTQNECLGTDEAFDKALYTIHPDWKE